MSGVHHTARVTQASLQVPCGAASHSEVFRRRVALACWLPSAHRRDGIQRAALALLSTGFARDVAAASSLGGR